MRISSINNSSLTCGKKVKNNESNINPSFAGYLDKSRELDRYMGELAVMNQIHKFEDLIANKIQKDTRYSLRVGINGVKPHDTCVGEVAVESGDSVVHRKENLKFYFNDPCDNLDTSSGFYYNIEKSIQENADNFWNMLLDFARGSVNPKK